MPLGSVTVFHQCLVSLTVKDSDAELPSWLGAVYVSQGLHEHKWHTAGRLAHYNLDSWTQECRSQKGKLVWLSFKLNLALQTPLCSPNSLAFFDMQVLLWLYWLLWQTFSDGIEANFTEVKDKHYWLKLPIVYAFFYLLMIQPATWRCLMVSQWSAWFSPTIMLADEVSVE